MRFHIKRSSYHHYAYCAHYACTMSTMPTMLVLCLLCLYYACTMLTMPIYNYCSVDSRSLLSMSLRRLLSSTINLRTSFDPESKSKIVSST